MVSVGLLTRFEAEPGKEEAVAGLLAAAIETVNKEDGTVVWFALKFGATSFGVFDAFPDDAARQQHLAANLSALNALAGDLLVSTPTLEPAEVLAAKMGSA